MRDGWIQPDAIFDGERLLTGPGLRLDGGRVAEIGAAPADAARIAGTLTPGFIDLQVNGGGGVLLNDDPTPAGMAAIAAAHRGLGAAAILPTLITDTAEQIDRAADAAIAARGQDGIIGLHVEGPHISLARKGTHNPDFIRPLDARTMAAMRRLRAADVPVMLTLAPEAVQPGQIAELRALGVIVSIGHSDAKAEEVRAALAEGANCFTHLFNAMSPLLHRAPGVVGAALCSDQPAGIICDGIHVDDSLVGMVVRARPAPDLMFLVSDAMPTVGGPDHFRLYDMDLRVVDGALVNPHGSLAGAHVTMAQSVARAITHVGLAPETALRMAVTIPARVAGRPDLAQIIGRPARDIVVMAPDWAYDGWLDAR